MQAGLAAISSREGRGIPFDGIEETRGTTRAAGGFLPTDRRPRPLLGLYDRDDRVLEKVRRFSMCRAHRLRVRMLWTMSGCGHWHLEVLAGRRITPRLLSVCSHETAGGRRCTRGN